MICKMASTQLTSDQLTDPCGVTWPLHCRVSRSPTPPHPSFFTRGDGRGGWSSRKSPELWTATNLFSVFHLPLLGKRQIFEMVIISLRCEHISSNCLVSNSTKLEAFHNESSKMFEFTQHDTYNVCFIQFRSTVTSYGLMIGYFA